MLIPLREENDGHVLAIRINGKLTKADYEQLVPEFERLVRQHGNVRLMFDMSDFHGWETGAAWEDFKFGVKHFADIERLVMVGEKKWQQGLALFCKPFTRAQVRYFDQTEAVAAREWLEAE